MFARVKIWKQRSRASTELSVNALEVWVEQYNYTSLTSAPVSCGWTASASHVIRASVLGRQFPVKNKSNVKSAYCFWPITEIRPELTPELMLFCSRKRLGVFLLPTRWDASPSQGYSQHWVRKDPFIHLGGERHCESKESCPRTQCNFPGQTRTQTAWSGHEHTNHEANAPPYWYVWLCKHEEANNNKMTEMITLSPF